MARKIIYKESSLLGDKIHNSSAMCDIDKKDEKYHILSQSKQKKELFNELKKYRDGGVTKKELKNVLASLKYGASDHFSVSEINKLAKEFKLGVITKNHLPSKALSHSSRIDRAQHVANFTKKDATSQVSKNKGQKRQMPNDDIVHYEARSSIERIFGKKNKKIIIQGDMVFDQEQEEMSFFDQSTGKKFFGKTTHLARPDFHIKSQTSLRGRGFIAGGKNI